MKRLLGNLILLALVVLVIRYGIVSTVLCWREGGTWKLLEQTCSLGTIELPHDSFMPSPSEIEQGIRNRIDFSKLREVIIMIPNGNDTTAATLAKSNDALARFVASFPQPGGVEGYAQADAGLAATDAETGLTLIPFVVNYGGTGSFVYLGLFEQASGSPTHRDSLLLGDRVSVESVSFERTGTELRAVALLKDRKDGEPMATPPSVPIRISAPLSGTSFGEPSRETRSDSASVTYKDLIRVTSPTSGSTVGSPIVITGEARGNWYFEASFPLTVVDWDGKIIGEGFASAKGDWMTTEYVPFEATLQYDLPADIPYRRGSLILRKDNPSGLPENDDAFEIPINFK